MITAFNFLQLPGGFYVWTILFLFAVTGEASGPVARVNHASGITRGDLPAVCVPAGFGVTEQSAAACRGTGGGSISEPHV